jgi:hypothetical protein
VETEDFLGTQGQNLGSMRPTPGGINPRDDISMIPEQSTQKKQPTVSSDTSISPPAREPVSTGTVESLGTFSVDSDITGADVYIDDSFIGKAPVTLRLQPGQHSVRGFAKGYKNWSQWITMVNGSSLRVKATFEKLD